MKQASVTRIKRVTRHSASYPRTVPTLIPPPSPVSPHHELVPCP